MSNNFGHGDRGLRQKLKKRERLFREYYEKHPEERPRSVVVTTSMRSYGGRGMSASDPALIEAFGSDGEGEAA